MHHQMYAAYRRKLGYSSHSPEVATWWCRYSASLHYLHVTRCKAFSGRWVVSVSIAIEKKQKFLPAPHTEHGAANNGARWPCDYRLIFWIWSYRLKARWCPLTLVRSLTSGLHKVQWMIGYSQPIELFLGRNQLQLPVVVQRFENKRMRT